MEEFFTLLKRVSRTDASILLRGETGTGKELVAQAIHTLSQRSNHRFAAVNCATLTPDLLASELFGHTRGSFTGAVQDKKGLFLVADKGSLFLDEVAEMPLDIQARLLRVLQEKTIVPVGSTEPIQVNVRIISATNKSLREQVEKGNFREDLMYRIRVVPMFLPKLTEREGDTEALTWYFVNQNNRIGIRNVNSIEKRAMEAILEYSWPGNVRELKNNIEYAFAVGEGEVLRLSELTPELQGIGYVSSSPSQITESDLERERIIKALDRANGKKGAAAQELGMSRSTLWRKLREHHLVR
jgi:two-component system response regulator AtoC